MAEIDTGSQWAVAAGGARMTMNELIQAAKQLAQPRELAGGGSCATIAAALRTAAGEVHTGVCLDLLYGLGGCAERFAAGDMVKGGETRVSMIVAVDQHGTIVAPCGACREFLVQLDPANHETQVVLGSGKTKVLRELLP